MFKFPSINQDVRACMLKEFERDLDLGNLYISSRLSVDGVRLYPDLLREAILIGDTETLSSDLMRNRCFKSYEWRRRKQVRVPVNASETLAEGELNRFYIRGLCTYAIDNNIEYLEVCRGKNVRQSRQRSLSLIGQMVPPYGVRADLRIRPGVETALGIPGGPNSGITLRIVEVKGS